MKEAWLTIDRPQSGVAVLTLNRPASLNAVTLGQQHELDALLTSLEDDTSTRCLIVTGSGKRAFCAGYDLHEMVAWDEHETLRALSEREELIWRWATTPLPVIAALNGLTYGYGAILASAVDMRIGTSNTVFKFTAGQHGGANATWSLPDLIGRGRATEILMSARPVDSAEAERIGLLDRVAAPPELLPTSIAVAKSIADIPPAGVRAIKRLVREHAGSAVRERFAAENTLMRNQLQPSLIRDLYAEFLDRPTHG